ncbi:MAG: tetratricopeptide repeat protein [Chloroflexi bacterium]|nr:tetratricopeptide repeat protein [Chloroflexota bacterium]
MASLEISLLGRFQVTRDRQTATEFEADTARALLAYLAMQAGTSIRREFLAGLLWPEQAESTALRNLRSALNRLRNVIGDKAADPPFLAISRKALAFNPDSDYWLDVTVFAAALQATESHRHRRLEGCPFCLKRLRQAADLYRGDFLTGLSVESIDFAEWATLQREVFHRQAVEACFALAEHHLRRGEHIQAQRYARQQLALEPWREEAHRQLMTALAASGQRSAALAQYARCQEVLERELGVPPEEETLALYRHIRDGQAPAVTARETGGNLASVLASLGTPFFGRGEEVEALVCHLVDPINRLVTVVGEGGVGKTRLALRAAAAVQGSFLDGVWFVPLVGVDTDMSVPAGQDRSGGTHEALVTAIAGAIGFPFHGAEPLHQQLFHYLDGKELLLILDNFEHLLAEAKFLLALLEKAPRCALLVTSRTRLNFQREWVLRLEGLPTPAEATPDAASFSSVRLFAERAGRTAASFVLSEENLGHVSQVCRYLQGIPLGIELAAAWAERLSPQEIARSLHDNLDFLATSMQDVPRRHRSMQTVFEHSWRLLAAEERLVLACVSVFRDAFTGEAAQAIIGAQPLEPIARPEAGLPGVETVLHRLATKSLLQPTGEGRYDLHELLRQFGATKLAEGEAGTISGDIPAVAPFPVRERHSIYFLNLVAGSEEGLYGRDFVNVRRRIQSVLNDVREAWRWARWRQRWHLLARATDGLSAFYTMSGLLQEAETIFAEAVEDLRGELAVAHAPAQEGRRTLAHLLLAWADFLLKRQHLDRVHSALQEVITLARFAAAPLLEARGQCSLGWCLDRQGRYPEALEQLTRALSLARSLGKLRLQAECLNHMGSVSFSAGNWTMAIHRSEEALALYREVGDRVGEGSTLHNLGVVAASREEYDRAMAYWQAALDIVRELEVRHLQVDVLYQIGAVADALGDYATAQIHYKEALQIAEGIGYLFGANKVYINVAISLDQVGEYEQAVAYARNALAFEEKAGNRAAQCVLLANLSLHFHHLGDNRTALGYARQAAELAQEIERPELLTYAWDFQGHALAELGDAPGAAEAYRRALALRQKLGQPQLAMESQAGLARVALAQGQRTEALAHAASIVDHLMEHVLEGPEEPLRAYLTVYRVLDAVGDARSDGILGAAHSLLQERARKIADPAMRHSYLHNVAAHREIEQLWSAM